VEVSRLVGTTIAILLRLDLVGSEVPITHQVSKIISIFSILIDTSRWARADAISFSSLRRKYSRHHSLRQHCDCESFQWRRQHFRAEHRRYVGQSERYLALVFQEYLGFLYAYCFINFLQWQCLPVVTHSMARGLRARVAHCSLHEVAHHLPKLYHCHHLCLPCLQFIRTPVN
jgi:hypothetical protein